jgi:neutral ceramidase
MRLLRAPLVASIVFGSPALWTQAGELRVGAASVVITPPSGTPMAGYYFARASEGVHDDLLAKAIVIERDGQKVALVGLDLISTTRDLVDDARRAIEQTSGIPGGRVMISASHAHTGPVLAGRGPKGGDMGRDSSPARTFRAALPGKIAEAVRLAAARLGPARALVGHGRETSIAFNRRFHMKDGSVGWNPGKLNPNIVKAAGMIDPDVPVIHFESPDGKPLATYVNHAVHLDDIGGLEISADMPYTLAKSLAEFKGSDMVTLYTTGCCGDVNHIDVTWPDPQHGFGNAARMGVILAGEVLRTWPHLKAAGAGALRAKTATVPLDLPPIQPGDVDKARVFVARHNDAKAKPPGFLETVWAYKVLDVAAREGKPNEVEVQVIALGDDIAWVSLPGEIFVELGLAIKKDSPFSTTVVAELANGSIGYVPAARCYSQGNYEVVSARCAEGSGERLVAAALKLLEELHSKGSSRGQ